MLNEEGGNNQPSVSGNVPNHSWKHKVNTLIILSIHVAVNLSFKGQYTRIFWETFGGGGVKSHFEDTVSNVFTEFLGQE